MTIDELRSQIGSVEGWLTETEGITLFHLAQRCSGKGVILEIGSWKGKSSIWLAHGSRSGCGAQVYAVDPHLGHAPDSPSGVRSGTFGEFRENLVRFGVAEQITPLVTTSEIAAATFDHPIELLFIDGAHAYDLVKLDFDLWCPKVVEGGTIVLHDSNAGGIPLLDRYLIKWPGPRRIAEERILRSRQFQNARLVDTMTLGEKVSWAPAAQVIRSRGLMALRLPYNALFRYSPRWLRQRARELMPQV